VLLSAPAPPEATRTEGLTGEGIPAWPERIGLCDDLRGVDGWLVSESGTPVSGAVIVLVEDRDQPDRSTRSGSDGSFHLEGSPLESPWDGRLLDIRHPDFVTKRIVLDPWVTEANVVMNSGRKLVLDVRFDDAEPAADAHIDLVVGGGHPSILDVGRAGPDGLAYIRVDAVRNTRLRVVHLLSDPRHIDIPAEAGPAGAEQPTPVVLRRGCALTLVLEGGLASRRQLGREVVIRLLPQTDAEGEVPTHRKQPQAPVISGVARFPASADPRPMERELPESGVTYRILAEDGLESIMLVDHWLATPGADSLRCTLPEPRLRRSDGRTWLLPIRLTDAAGDPWTESRVASTGWQLADVRYDVVELSGERRSYEGELETSCGLNLILTQQPPVEVELWIGDSLRRSSGPRTPGDIAAFALSESDLQSGTGLVRFANELVTPGRVEWTRLGTLDMGTRTSDLAASVRLPAGQWSYTAHATGRADERGDVLVEPDSESVVTLAAEPGGMLRILDPSDTWPSGFARATVSLASPPWLGLTPTLQAHRMSPHRGIFLDGVPAGPHVLTVTWSGPGVSAFGESRVDVAAGRTTTIELPLSTSSFRVLTVRDKRSEASQVVCLTGDGGFVSAWNPGEESWQLPTGIWLLAWQPPDSAEPLKQGLVIPESGPLTDLVLFDP